MRIGRSGVAKRLVLAAMLLGAWFATAFAQQPTPDQIAAIRAILPLRFHVALRRRSTRRQRRTGMSQAQRRQRIGALQVGARRRRPKAGRQMALSPRLRRHRYLRQRPISRSRRAAPPASAPEPSPAAAPPCPADARTPADRSRKSAAAASRRRPRGLPRRFRRALPRREAGRCCRTAMPASQRRRAFAAMPPRRGSHGRRRRRATASGGARGAGRIFAVRRGRTARADPTDAAAPGAAEILSFCGPERAALCGDVPPGGGRIIQCLADQAPRLSPTCYGAIARAIR